MPTTPHHLQAVLLATGNELMTGDLVDSNSAWLAKQLTELQVGVRAKLTVGDQFEELVWAMTQAIEKAGLVILTGGLGPTSDDLTRALLARVSGRPLQRDPELLREIEAFFHQLGRTMKPVNRIQAEIPEGAQGLSNPVGTAPGIRIEIGAATVFALPGVPREMTAMFETHVRPWILQRTPPTTHRISILCCGRGESDLVEELAEVIERIRSCPELSFGTRASDSVIALKLTGPRADELEQYAREIENRLGPIAFGRGNSTLAEVVTQLLFQNGQSVVVAESCTAGEIGHEITTIPGSSQVFPGGWISYSNEFKHRFLDVPQPVLDSFGAVSDACVLAMAEGALQQSGADWAIAVSGIAGPGGGSPEKPVGLVYFAVGQPGNLHVFKRTFSNLGRETIRRRATLTALNALRLRLLNIEPIE